MRLVRRALVALLVMAGVLAFGGVGSPPPASDAGTYVFEGPVPRARCGPGSLPETSVQGRVPLEDRKSGRNLKGYRCNLERLGRFQGEGSSWVSQSYGRCAYMSTRFPHLGRYRGVQVIDVADPSKPRWIRSLTSPAMLGTWESLKVNPARGLLAAVFAPSPAGNGVALLDVYDIKTDCTKPRLLGSVSTRDLALPANALGHEGEWAPDGRTYWAAGATAGVVTAIDVADPTRPRMAYTGTTGFINHGLSVSDDGNRLYVAEVGDLAGFVTGGHVHVHAPTGNGVNIVDVSDVQSRRPLPRIHRVGQLRWTDGSVGQHAIKISYRGRPHLVFVDEGGAGAARIIDIVDERAPRVVSKLKLAIHDPRYADLRAADTSGSGLFGYEGHYCTADRTVDPTALACGYFQSGVRVFDIRNPRNPQEIAYYNPPAQAGKNARLPGSEHAQSALSGDLSADWCSSPPRLVSNQLWVTCQDNGFMVLRFTNRAYPLRPASS